MPVIATSDDLPVTVHVRVYQGQTKRLSFTWTAGGSPVDLTGWTGRFRAKMGGAVVLDVAMTLGGAAGTAERDLTPAETAALPAGTGGRYELLLTGGDGDVTVLAVGPFSVAARVGG